MFAVRAKIYGVLYNSNKHVHVLHGPPTFAVRAKIYGVLYNSNKHVHVLHGPSMFAVRAKIYGVLYNQASSIAFDETSNYWSALKSS